MLHQFAYEGVTGNCVKSHTKVKRKNIHCSPFIHYASHRRPTGWLSVIYTINICWLLQITLLSLINLEMVSRINCSSRFQGLRWGQTVCSVLDLPSSPSWRQEWHQLSSPNCHRLLVIINSCLTMTSFLSTHGCTPSGAIVSNLMLLHWHVFLALNFPTGLRGLWLLKAKSHQ